MGWRTPLRAVLKYAAKAVRDRHHADDSLQAAGHGDPNTKGGHYAYARVNAKGIVAAASAEGAMRPAMAAPRARPTSRSCSEESSLRSKYRAAAAWMVANFGCEQADSPRD
jgi:hypothetical protein